MAGGFQGGVEPDFFRDHGFGFHHQSRPGPLGSHQVEDDAARFRRVGGEVHLKAVAARVGDELLENLVPVG